MNFSESFPISKRHKWNGTMGLALLPLGFTWRSKAWWAWKHETNAKCPARLKSYFFYCFFPLFLMKWGVWQWVRICLYSGFGYFSAGFFSFALTLFKQTIAMPCLLISFHRLRVFWPFPSYGLCLSDCAARTTVPVLCNLWHIVTHETATHPH